MLKKILKQYNNNSEAILGVDGSYHTVYYIEFETGYFYIGKRSTKDYLTDSYFASGVLPNKLKNDGVKYIRNILFYFDSSELAIEAETELLQDIEIYGSEYCLNCYPGSPSSAYGTIIVNKEEKFKMINPKLKDYYLDLGWTLGGVKRIYVYNHLKETKFILVSELDSYLDNGWKLGSLIARNRIFIEKDGNFKFIKKIFLEDYMKDGWIYKHNQTGYKVLRKDDKLIKVKLEKVEEFLKLGYENSSTVKDLIYIRNIKTKDLRRVKIDEIDSFVNDGWEITSNSKDTIYINDGMVEKRIPEKELSNYINIGYKKGRISKIYMTNGIVEKRLMSNLLVEDFIKKGFYIGKLKRIKKTIIYKEKQKKMVNPDELSSYISNGWTDVFDKSIHHNRKKRSCAFE